MGLLIQLFVGLVLFATAAFLYEYVYKVHRIINFYKSQGVTIDPGVTLTRLYLSNDKEIDAAYKKAAAESDEPLPPMHFWAFKYAFAPETEFEFYPERHKAVLKFKNGKPRLLICDPDIAQDIFVTKNRLVDKTGEEFKINEEALGESFLFSKGDESWARKRKACAHAFYKHRLEIMMQVLKDKLKDIVTNWLKKIEANPDGQIVIDLA